MASEMNTLSMQTSGEIWMNSRFRGFPAHLQAFGSLLLLTSAHAESPDPRSLSWSERYYRCAKSLGDQLEKQVEGFAVLDDDVRRHRESILRWQAEVREKNVDGWRTSQGYLGREPGYSSD